MSRLEGPSSLHRSTITLICPNVISISGQERSYKSGVAPRFFRCATRSSLSSFKFIVVSSSLPIAYFADLTLGSLLLVF
ncbi:hypothetical protein EV356DRAFT_498549 [Viridothelium virens]|uniref:Uncharacterized protein n=1 Tax=Viridothelium virens TaxID=1048519 RepID=A0A6A6HEM5_VIRVR|nr:hypothetical protein EV356DRAFT_498549 [Viridothelium virens]